MYLNSPQGQTARSPNSLNIVVIKFLVYMDFQSARYFVSNNMVISTQRSCGGNKRFCNFISRIEDIVNAEEM